MGNGTAWSNSTGHVAAHSFSINTTIHLIESPSVKRHVNASLPINTTTSIEKPSIFANQTIYTNLTARAESIIDPILITRVSKLFHARRSLHKKKANPWTNSISHIEARRAANLTELFSRLANFTARATLNSAASVIANGTVVLNTTLTSLV
jgi:hypothetical protein